MGQMGDGRQFSEHGGWQMYGEFEGYWRVGVSDAVFKTLVAGQKHWTKNSING